MSELRILYLLPGPAPPRRDPRESKFFHLSEVVGGDVLNPIWWSKPENVREAFGPDAYPVHREGRFSHHFEFCPLKLSKPRRLWRRLRFYLREGGRILRQGNTSVVMTYGANLTGLAGVLLKRRHGVKLIVEVPGVPHLNNVIADPNPTLAARIKQKVSERLFLFVLQNADHAKLLYPQQLDAFEELRDTPRSVFHNMVPARAIPAEPADAHDPYILLLGHPWYRKGADIVIRAFHEIADDFPELRLKLVGWKLDRDEPKRLAAGHPRIEFLGAVKHDEAMRLMSRCAVFVMGSRSEAMGRVTLEAMAARRPIVGSAVDGVPHYVKDGFNGLLFEPGDPKDLARKLRTLLEDPELAARLATNAYDHLHAELDEAAFVRRFDELLDAVLPDRREEPAASPGDAG